MAELWSFDFGVGVLKFRMLKVSVFRMLAGKGFGGLGFQDQGCQGKQI